MKNLIRFFAISFFVLTLTSCSDNYNNSNTGSSITTFSATINGANEVPSTNSTATGTATLLFNNTTKIFTISVTHSLAAATMGHIHLGAAGSNGGVVFPFSSPSSPIAYTSIALTALQEADLKANLYYVNLHSAAFTSGEIRGQLIQGATTGKSTGGGY
jgi:hypothetical protein